MSNKEAILTMVETCSMMYQDLMQCEGEFVFIKKKGLNIPPNRNSPTLTGQILNSDTILKICCEVLDVNIKDALGRKRNREFVDCRRCAINIIFSEYYPQYSLKKIGRAFDRDHSTILHMRETHEILYENDRDYKKRYDCCFNAFIQKKIELTKF